LDTLPLVHSLPPRTRSASGTPVGYLATCSLPPHNPRPLFTHNTTTLWLRTVVIQTRRDRQRALLAYGVFGITNFWEHGVGAEGEVAEGKQMVDAVKDTGIKHFVWSTMEHSEFKPAHWESKANVDDYLKASGVPRTSQYLCCSLFRELL